jgi:hypothetical protein
VLPSRPFGRLADDVREFLWVLASGGLPLTDEGDLHAAGLRRLQALWEADGRSEPGSGSARLRAMLLRSLCEAGRLVEADDGALRLTGQGWQFLALPSGAQIGFVFAAWWEGMDWARWSPRAALGGLLRRERDVLLQELIGLPEGRVDPASFARRFRALVRHRWPTVLAAAGPEAWRRELWATALAPLAMLGAIDVPDPVTADPPRWFSVNDASGELLRAAVAISGPDPLCATSPNRN